MHLTHLTRILGFVLLLAINPAYCQKLSLESIVSVLGSDTISEHARFDFLNLAIRNSTHERVDSFYEEALKGVQKNDHSDFALVELSKSIFHTDKGEPKQALEILHRLYQRMDDFDVERQIGIRYQKAKNLQLTGKGEEAIKELEIVLHLTSENNFPVQKANAYFLLGTIISLKGDEKALDYYEKAKQIYVDAQKDFERGLVINTIGKFYKIRSQYDKALEYYQEAVEVFKNIGDLSLAAISFNNIGTVYHSKGDFELALENYVTSLKLKEKNGDKKSIGISYLNIGTIKISLEDYKNAEKDLRRALAIFEEFGIKSMTTFSLIKIGTTFNKRGMNEEALDYHERSLVLAKETNHIPYQIEARLGIGEDLIALTRYGEALEVLVEAEKDAKEFGRKASSGSAITLIAQAYSKSIEHEGGIDLENLNKVEELLIEGVQIGYDINNAKNIDNALSALKIFYRQQKNYKQEAFVADQLIQHRDSIFSSQKAHALSEWETKYETSEKEKEIILLQKENELQEAQAALTQNRFIIGFVSLFLLGGLGLMYFYYQNQIKRAAQMAEIRTKISSDLHDDVGSILSGLAMQTEVLAMTAKEVDKPKLERLGELSRNAMGRMRDTVWAIDSRKDKIENLLDRMREFAAETLTPKEFSYDLEIKNIEESKVIPANQRQNIYLIFKEAITNIIKHSNGNKVDILLKNEGNELILRIRDNGTVAEKSYKTTGLGTSNMERRAKQLGGHLSFVKEGGFEVFYKGVAL